MEPPTDSSWLVRVDEKDPQRGRGLFAATDISAGSVVLAEAPIVWWVDSRALSTVCAHCTKPISSGAAATVCATCGEAHWCSPECSAADETRHGAVCPLLSTAASLRGQCLSAAELRLSCGTPQNVSAPESRTSDSGAEEQSRTSDSVALRSSALLWQELSPTDQHECLTLLHLAAHSAALRASDAAAFALLWGQAADSPLSEGEQAQCAAVLGALRSAAGATPLASAEWLDLDFVRGLCQRDKANTFVITLATAAAAPAGPADAEAEEDAVERRPHAFGMYPTLPLANHCCLPTVARFDESDVQRVAARGAGAPEGWAAAPPLGACVGVLRAAVAQGDAAALARPPCSLAMRFVALHGLPKGSELMPSYVPLGDPEPQRRAHFGSEYGFVCRCRRCRLEREAAGEAAAVGAAASAPAEGDDDDVDLTYVALFLLKHTCEVCMGTLAPLSAAEGVPSVCNRCGAARSEDAFVARVEAYFSEEEQEAAADEALQREAEKLSVV